MSSSTSTNDTIHSIHSIHSACTIVKQYRDGNNSFIMVSLPSCGHRGCKCFPLGPWPRSEVLAEWTESVDTSLTILKLAAFSGGNR